MSDADTVPLLAVYDNCCAAAATLCVCSAPLLRPYHAIYIHSNPRLRFPIKQYSPCKRRITGPSWTPTPLPRLAAQRRPFKWHAVHHASHHVMLTPCDVVYSQSTPRPRSSRALPFAYLGEKTRYISPRPSSDLSTASTLRCKGSLPSRWTYATSKTGVVSPRLRTHWPPVLFDAH